MDALAVTSLREAQQFLAPFARPLLHQFELEVLFAKDNPESATEWLQAEMMEIAHEARSVGAAGVN